MTIFSRNRMLCGLVSVALLAGCGGGSVDINSLGANASRGEGTGTLGGDPNRPRGPALSVSEIEIDGTDAFTFEQDTGSRADKVIGLYEFVLRDATNGGFIRDLDSSNMTFKERRFGSDEPFLVEVEATQSSGIEVTAIDVMYLIDTSFSVVQAGAREELVKQANNLANEINARNSASGAVSDFTSYRTFADTVSLQETSLVEDPFSDIEFEERGGGTALYEGIELALSDLAASAQPVLFVFTDGRENASGPGYGLDLVLSTAEQYSIPIYIAGLGNVDANILNNIAQTSGGQFFQAATVDQLANVFEDVLRSIPVEYTVNYRPTQRSGHVEFQFVVDYQGATSAVVGDFNVDEILGASSMGVSTEADPPQ